MIERRIARVRVKRSNKRIAVAVADRAGKCREIFVEAAEHLQHRLLVVEENVAPHGGIGGGDAREIAKTAGRELDHLRARAGLEIRGGADDVVGDQMRQMARDREHEIVVPGVHDLDIGAEPLPERFQLRDRLFVGARGRRQDAPAVFEQFGEARVRPRMLGARHRMRRYEMRVRRNMRRHVAQHRAFDRADVGNDGAGFDRRADLRRDFARRRRPERRR